VARGIFSKVLLQVATPRKSLGVEVINLIILFRKLAKISLETTFLLGFFFIFKLQNFATIEKKTPH
jgi:hypothetical protein